MNILKPTVSAEQPRCIRPGATPKFTLFSEQKIVCANRQVTEPRYVTIWKFWNVYFLMLQQEFHIFPKTSQR